MKAVNLNNLFQGRTLTNRILLPIFGFVILLLVVIIIIAYSSTSKNLKSYFQDAVSSKSKFMSEEVDNMKTRTLNNLDWFENSARLSKALLEKNAITISDLGHTAMKSFEMDYFLVTDTSGNVISCAHDKTENGVNMKDHYMVLKALQGIKSSGVETTSKIPLLILASSPLRNEKGKIIGAILLGQSLNNENFVDRIKKQTGNEATVFFGSQRLMTTIKDELNQRIIGTKLGNPTIEKSVLEDGIAYYGESTIRGSKYKAAYLPLTSSNNKVVGMLFMGEKIDIINTLAGQISSYISIIAIILCVVILFLIRIILVKTILKPIKLLVKNADKIAKGEIDLIYVQSKTKEIKTLSNAFQTVSEKLKFLIDDIYILSNAAIEGNYEKRADLLKHNGSYAQAINGINYTLDSILNPLNELINEVSILSESAVNGNLALRANADKYKNPEFKKVIYGFNNTLDAVINPLNKAAEYIDRISKGDIPEKITEEYKGEFNKIKNNLNSLIKSINDIIDKSKTVAEGDLTVEFTKRSNNDELIIALIDMISFFSNIVEQVQISTENIAGATMEMSSNSQQVSQGASEQAASSEQVSASMEEMAANIQNNNNNAQQTEKIATKAANDILVGSKNVNETVDSMKKIADKVSIIGDIAFQTNILALNAAVEAARAGEHGRGFAVVAAEVRKLAERTQIAAAEINILSKGSVQIAEESGKLLASIVPDIQKTARLVQEITVASLEQNSGADQINNAINQLNLVTQQNAAAAEEMATSTEELASQSDQLREMVAFFKVHNEEKNVTKFKQQQSKNTSANHSTQNANFKTKKTGTIINMKEDDFEKF